MKQAYLAIDEGTTNCKALAVSRGGEVLAAGSHAVDLTLPGPGLFEQDGEQIAAAMAASIEQCLSGLTDTEIIGIGISNQRESVIAFSRSTGTPLGPVIGWQDSRTSDAAARLTELEPTVRERTGLHLDPMYSGTKMAWLADTLGAGLTDDTAITTIDAFLVHRLTGGAVLAGDATNAARTLVFNLTTLAWDEGLCAALGVPRHVLAEVRPSGAHYGTTVPFAGLKGGLPILAVMGDSHAALFGQRCDEPGIAKVSYGTGSSVMVPTLEFGRAAASTVDTTLGYLAGSPVYAREGNVLATGAALETMAGILGVDGGPGVSALARTCTDPGTVQVVPAFSGLAAPHWDRGAIGVITGLARDTSPAQIAHATLACVAHQIADIVDEVTASGDGVTSLRADGGASVDSHMMQVQADIIGVPVDASARAEIAALGAARMAAHTLGRGEEFDAAAPQFTRYEPALTGAARTEARSRWADAVDRSRGHATQPLK